MGVDRHGKACVIQGAGLFLDVVMVTSMIVITTSFVSTANDASKMVHGKVVDGATVLEGLRLLSPHVEHPSNHCGSICGRLGFCNSQRVLLP